MLTDKFNMNVEGVDQEFLIKTPSLADQREAQKVYNQAFSDAVKSGCIVRARLDDLLKEQGLWDDQKQIRFNTLQQQILDGEKSLSKGGISLKSAKEIAIKIKRLREEMRDLISVRTNLDNHTAEGQADNARFNYLVSACLVYNDTKQPYFKNLEDYLSRSSDKVALLAATNLANMLYGLDNDYEVNLPENKFLKRFKFVDGKLRLVDNKGRLVDEDGRLINEDGRFINEAGQFIDKRGNLVDEKGDYVVEVQPFLDDEGNPIIESSAQELPKAVVNEEPKPSPPEPVPVAQEQPQS